MADSSSNKSSEPEKRHVLLTPEVPRFKWSSLWQKPVINPLNKKSYTLSILNLSSPYGRNFHLSWLGFFVAFLSWFAFPPLIPEAIKSDLKLTADQVANSNIVALAATLIVRLCVGPLVDRYGPRLVMAGLLIVGAIPSGLAGTAHSASSLYVIRFFVGILGGTFVPCQAWTSAFFDKNIVGTANALVGGWGNAGGGATYAVMSSLYSKLLKHMPKHKAWRVAFAVVPVPILIVVAVMVIVFGTDHPAGKWSERHDLPAAAVAAATGHVTVLDETEKRTHDKGHNSADASDAIVHEVSGLDDDSLHAERFATVDVAINEPLTWNTAVKIILNPLTWLPALAYMTTFGFELAVDSVLGAALLAPHPSLGQLNSGYLASTYGLLNIITRPLGGFVADRLYVKFGVKSKKYLVLILGILQGVLTIGFGKYIQTRPHADLGVMMVFLVLMAIVNEMANGANFSLVPHCNSYNNGVMSGIVGSFGNMGGIFFALIFRFQTKQGRPWVISGAFALGVNAILLLFPAPSN